MPRFKIWLLKKRLQFSHLAILRIYFANPKPLTLATLSVSLIAVQELSAQTLCSNTPAQGTRVLCEESDTSTNNIEIMLEGVGINYSGPQVTSAIQADHKGTGSIVIDIASSLDQSDEVIKNILTTSGLHNHAISGYHTGEGRVNISVEDTQITTKKQISTGVFGYHQGDGEINISVEDSEITTEDSTSFAIHLRHQGNGRIILEVSDTIITTKGSGSIAIFANQDIQNTDEGADVNVSIEASSNTIITEGNRSNGIWGRSSNSGDVLITTNANSITTTGDSAHGIYGYHISNGDIMINSKQDEIETEGMGSHGIFAQHSGSGEVDISIETSSTTITTKGNSAIGIWGRSSNRGDIKIDTNSNTITTMKGSGHGILGHHSSVGDINIISTQDIIKTKGMGAHGIIAYHTETGEDTKSSDSLIDTSSTNITTEGDRSIGIYGIRSGLGDVKITTNSISIITGGGSASGIYGQHSGIGDINIISTQDIIKTKGMGAHGIIAYHTETGEDTKSSDSLIDASSTNIATEGDRSIGIVGIRSGLGDVLITTNANSITTTGDSAHGIYGQHSGIGDINIISTQDIIKTKGMGAHGIFAYHTETGEDRSIRITVGGNIDLQGENSQGVRIGDLDSGNVVGGASFDTEGFRKQTVFVDGSINSGGVGVFLTGGGRVIIGPTGFIDSNSRSLILATGDTPGEDQGDSSIKPKLHISINLAGRTIADIIGDDGWIINDGGGTTIVINEIKLHDSIEGVIPGAVVVEGIKEYRIRPEGVRVIDRTTEPWIISAPALGVIADRDFSVEDFIWGFAPRAALYEVLPNFLLNLNKQESWANHIWSSDSPYWVRLSRKFWAYQPTHSTVGTEYKSNQNLVEAGMDFRLGDNLVSSASISRIEGSADVATTHEGGGKILADGFGLALDLSLDRTDGWYARSGFSIADYALDFWSDERGIIASDIGAKNWSFDVEAGRNIKLNSKFELVPRIRAEKTSISVDNFTDNFDSHVVMPKTSRQAVSIGLIAKMKQTTPRMGGELDWQASLDFEKSSDGDGTLVQVSGVDLISKARSKRFILGLSGIWRRDNLFIKGEIRAIVPSSAKTRYSGQITFGVNF